MGNVTLTNTSSQSRYVETQFVLSYCFAYTIELLDCQLHYRCPHVLATNINHVNHVPTLVVQLLLNSTKDFSSYIHIIFSICLIIVVWQGIICKIPRKASSNQNFNRCSMHEKILIQQSVKRKILFTNLSSERMRHRKSLIVSAQLRQGIAPIYKCLYHKIR